MSKDLCMQPYVAALSCIYDIWSRLDIYWLGFMTIQASNKVKLAIDHHLNIKLMKK